MKITNVFALVLTLGIAMLEMKPANAQNKLPVIHSGIKSISIRDGRDLSKNTWNLNPESKPDVYFTQVPRGNRKITFITDKDSISFVTSFGKTYDFIVLLNGKDSCLTRISANYEGLISPASISTRQQLQRDTLPFFMKNSRIYFRGKLNGKKDFVMMFDFGAGMTCLNKKSAGRSGANFDGTISVSNTSGTNDEPSASSNSIEIAGLRWDHVPLVQVSNMDQDEDMIIGNTLLRDKIVEIDYEKKIMILTDQVKKDLSGYSAHHVMYYQQRPRFEVDVKIGNKFYPFHFLFDTGRDGTMLIGDDFTNTYGLWDKYQTIITLGRKKIVVIPEVKIGNRVFKEIVTNVNDPKHPNAKQSLLGNEVLNQFNVVLDNHNGVIYLKPNMLQNEDYSTYRGFKEQMTLIILAALAVIGLLFFGIRKWLSYRKSRRTERSRQSTF